jgi:rare lipoprotein A
MPLSFWIVAPLLLAAWLGGCSQSPYATEMSLAQPVAPKPTPAAPPNGAWQTTTAMIPTAAIAPIAKPSTPSAAPARPVALKPHTTIPTRHHELEGIASYYWQDQMTASGERFDKNAMTAAHKTLPLGTRVKVTHSASGRSVVVRINDRGPFKPGRVIDLSEAAAKQLQMTSAGLAKVKVEVVQ